jgi:hypothetical protein
MAPAELITGELTEAERLGAMEGATEGGAGGAIGADGGGGVAVGDMLGDL